VNALDLAIGLRVVRGRLQVPNAHGLAHTLEEHGGQLGSVVRQDCVRGPVQSVDNIIHPLFESSPKLLFFTRSITPCRLEAQAAAGTLCCDCPRPPSKRHRHRPSEKHEKYIGHPPAATTFPSLLNNEFLVPAPLEAMTAFTRRDID